MRWSRHVGALDDDATALLLTAGARQPATAAAVFAQALTLRAALTALFRAIAHDGAPAAADREHLQAMHPNEFSHTHLSPRGSGYGWTCPAAEIALARPLWLLAQSAITLLTTDDLARVRQGPGTNDCGWLFYDTSKNSSRRWCSLEGCGSSTRRSTGE